MRRLALIRGFGSALGTALCLMLAGIATDVAAGPADPSAPTTSVAPAHDYLIAPLDIIHVTVFQNPDLTLDARVAKDGSISYPLLGNVALSGLSVAAAEQKLATLLQDGGFLNAPHVTVSVVQVKGNQVTVLGQVGKPGQYPLDAGNSHLSETVALAGGINSTGSDVVILTGNRNGKPIRQEVDLHRLAMHLPGTDSDPVLENGDMLYVPRAPVFYIYGEVQKPGSFRLEANMTVIQALATGGGLTPKGTQRGLSIHRLGSDGSKKVIEPSLDDAVLPDDVIYVREGLF